MPKSLFLIVLIYLATTVVAHSHPDEYYQIDLILFLHQPSPKQDANEIMPPVLPLSMQHPVKLDKHRESTSLPYKLLPVTASALRNEYRAINRQPQYQVLFFGSWLQTQNSQKGVSFASVLSHDWQAEGVFKIQKRQYFDLDAQLLFKSPDNQHSSFVLTRHQRLKNNDLYYLDHPQGGMLIKIHAPA